MSSNTPNLNLYKVDPTTDGEQTFNIETMLNDNWDKIDQDVATKDDLNNITIPVQSVNNKTGDVTLTASDVGAETPDDAQTKASTAETNAINFAKGYGLGSIAKAAHTISSDWNDHKDTGFYMGTGMTNRPPYTATKDIHGWDFVIVIKHNTYWVMQIASDFNNRETWQRSAALDSANNTISWKSWKRMLDDTDISSFVQTAVEQTFTKKQIFNAGVWFEDGDHAITHNDGGGNFNFRVGHRMEPGVGPIYSDDGKGAIHLNFGHENANPAFTINISEDATSKLAGDIVTFTKALEMRSDGTFTWAGNNVWTEGNLPPSELKGWKVISNQTLAAQTSSINLSNIDSKYDFLKLYISKPSGNSVNASIQFNGVATTVYDTRWMYNNGNIYSGASIDGTSIYADYIGWAGATSEIFIDNRDANNVNGTIKTVHSQILFDGGFTFDQNSKVSSITINQGDFPIGTKVTLIGGVFS